MSNALIVCIGLVLGLLPGALAAASIEDFFGRWQAESVTGGGDLMLEPDDFVFEAGPASGQGFIARWTSLELARDAPGPEFVKARFAPTGRPGVYAYAQDSSLLASLFASPETGNPLAGDRLLWARLEGDTLIIYSLALDRHGRFRLHRISHTLDEQGLAVVQTVRTGPAEPLVVEGRFAPAGG